MIMQVISFLLKINIMQLILNGWMVDVKFYVLFNRITVMSGPLEFDNERLCAMESIYNAYEPGTPRSVGQCLTY